MESFPSNDRVEQAKITQYSGPKKKKAAHATEEVEAKKVQRVVTGEVIQRKKPLSRRFTEMFLTNGSDILRHIFYEVIIPAARDTAHEAGNAGLDRIFYPDGGGSRRSRSAAKGVSQLVGQTAYNRIVQSGGATVRNEAKQQMSRRGRTMHDFKEIILDDRAQANETIDMMRELLDKFEVVTVGDLYDMVGITGYHTDEKYGWYNLGSARVVRTREGYLLDLSSPELLE